MVLAWAPLPFASTPPRAQAWLWIAAAGLLAGGVTALGLKPPGQQPRWVRLGASALVAVALVGVLQWVPLPASWVATLSPTTYALAGESAALIGAPPTTLPLALAADVALANAAWWAGAAALFCVTAMTACRRGARRVLGGAILGGALFQILYGAQLWFRRSQEIWGQLVPERAIRLRGTFVNPDHLAVYLELALALATAVVWWTLHRARQSTSLEHRLLYAAPPLLLWGTIFVALAFTGSRAGLLAAVSATLAQGLLLTAMRRRARSAIAIAVLLVLGLALVSALGHAEGFGRLLDVPIAASLESRLTVAMATVELWLRFPVFGCGLGGFREAFPLVRPWAGDSIWRHAHNNPLELLATGGLLAALAFLVGLLAVLGRLLTVLRTAERSEDRAAALAGLGALAALAIHESLDFGLAMPANAFTALVLVVAAASPMLVRAAADESTRRGRSGNHRERSGRERSGRERRVAHESAANGTARSVAAVDPGEGSRADGAAGERLEAQQVKPGRNRAREAQRRP